MRHVRPALASALAVVLASVLLAVGILLYRPLPTIDGHVRFLGLRERAEVRRDGFGVPYILARNAYDLYFLQGYVTAQDRLFQMDLFRRIARSDSERVLGQRGRDVDAAARRLGILERARADLSGSTDVAREMVTAYTAGVNKFMEQHADGALPIEFTILGYRVRPWSDEDVVSTFHAHAIGLSSASADADVLRSALGHLGGDEFAVCWSISGSRTSSGSPVVAGEMRVSTTAPVPWHEVALERPGLRAAGLSIPGVPGVLAGRNQRMAWTFARATPIAGTQIVPAAGGPSAPPVVAQPSAELRLGPPKIAAMAVLAVAGNGRALADAIGDLGMPGVGACFADERTANWTSAARPAGLDPAIGFVPSGRLGIAAGRVVDLDRDPAALPDDARRLVEALRAHAVLDPERSRAILNALGGKIPAAVTFAHPLSERYGLGILDIGPIFPRYGASGRPAVRFIADLAGPDRSWSVLPTGQSAHLISPHRTDQAALWGAGRLKPIGLRRDRITIVEGDLVLRAR